MIHLIMILWVWVVRNSNAPPEFKKSTVATFGSGSGRGEG